MTRPHPHHDVYTAGFAAGERDFIVRGLLGKAGAGGSDAGEVLATLALAGSHDDHGWYQAWLDLGQRVAGVADTCAAGGHSVSAARAYLRAANYLAVAVDAQAAARDDSALVRTFRAHRTAWDGFVAHTPWSAEAFDVPYDAGALPGWFFRPDETGRRRPTLVVYAGSDEAISGTWCEAAEPALQRDYNVFVFDAPGQQSELFERGVPFRPDSEAVLTPVVDAILARPDVEPGSLAVYGVSQAGFWVPRALAFEHRFAAAVVDPGVVDVAASWRTHIPRSVLAHFDRGDADGFDREMDLGMRMPGQADARALWAFRARPYGTSGYAATLAAVSRYRLGDEVAGIRTPLLVTAPEGEQFWPGQSAELVARVPGAELLGFRADEGAGLHCQPMARELTAQRVFDWLDDRIG
jgi:hypothetical protein